MDKSKAKWKKVKEEEWQEHVTKDEVKEDGPAITLKE